MNTSIKPGRVWLDTQGKRIQAHGAVIYYEDGIYYWIGENKEHTTKESDIWTWGVKCYTSKDLYNWKDEGFLIEPDVNNRDSIFHPARRLDRPHLLYCERTKQYVLWLKYCDGAHYSVLTADSIMGPYTIVRGEYRPFDVRCGDFDLAKDEKSGQAYLYFEVNHTDVWCVRLSDDYTEVSGDYSIIYQDIKPPFTREGVTHFERKGKHYILTSGMTGYIPNPSEAAVGDDWMGPFTVQGNPHVNDGSRSSFNSQISCVFKAAGKEDLYIAAADRWVPEYVMTAEKYDVLSRAISAHYDPSVKVTDEERRSLMDMPMLETANTSIADYVWLPLAFDGDRVMITWHEEWSL